MEFDRFLRNYPRPLEARPPGKRTARFRDYRDLTLGEWPRNVVAKTHVHYRNGSQWIRGEYAQYWQR